MNGLFQSNSWGHVLGSGQYNNYAAESDTAIYNHPRVMILWALGNSDSGVRTGNIGNEAASKNGLSVGGIFHENTADMSDDAWHNNGPGGTPSMGPTADGRQKPDVVGPFDLIYTTDITGSGGYSGGDYCDNFGGTSGSTPVVAGIVGQTYEMFIEDHFGNNPEGAIPTSAMVKAILIADAYQYPLGSANRNMQGWGSPDAQRIYELGADHHYLEDDQQIAPGGSWYHSVETDGSMPLKMSLVWTDPAAAENTGEGRALINNLDLKLIGPSGEIWRGNKGLYSSLWSTPVGVVPLENHWSLASDSRDDLNNVENIFIEDPEPGTYRVEVYGREEDMVGAQSFSLAVAGAHAVDTTPWKVEKVLVDTITSTVQIDVGDMFYVYFDPVDMGLTAKPPEGLPEECTQALDIVPEWLRSNLSYKFRQLSEEYQITYANLILNSPEDRYVDEIAFCVAHTAVSNLQDEYFFPELFTHNAQLIYENDQYLDYVEVVEMEDHTTVLYNDEDNLSVLLPKEIYYWYIVHPKLSDELPTYVDPDYNYVEDPPGDRNYGVAPPTGKFWRDWLFYYSDTDYPLLKEAMEDCYTVWDAIYACNGWVSSSMEFTSNDERPIQPVRIYRKHIGRCGEHQDLRNAIARACLIPSTCTSNAAEDHVWNEFWDGRWIHWDGAVDNPMMYEDG
ncbi:MAG: S8 family serine peptidase, partial [Thermoplasmata archaeon]|nr:S8 family serine peptidase [Thermoplasmata archaeon]